MVTCKNLEFWGAMQGARNAEAKIVRGCTARLRSILIVNLRNVVVQPKNKFLGLPNAD